MSYALGIVCRSCGRRWPQKDFLLVCPDCRSPVEISYDLDGLGKHLKRKWPQPGGTSLLQQWADALPVARNDGIAEITLGEMQTPLIRSKVVGAQMGLTDLRFKVEIGPTLSLKDRGTSLCALKALELGFEAMCVASSGNNAGSVAAYAAKAGLPAIVFVPRDTSPAKLTKMLSYGAKVVRVDGDMHVASRLCKQMRKRRRWMESGGPNPFRMTAKRLVAYEIFAQTGRRVPDAVVLPCGGSAGIVAAHTGFTELMQMGLIDRRPRLIGVQLAACDPVTQAFERHRDRVTPVEKRPSISDALMNNSPYWGARALWAARDTEGIFLSVSDDEVTWMMAALGIKEGLFLEPAGAVAVAGLKKALDEARIQGVRKAICTLTGHGFNARPTARGQLQKIKPLQPDPSTVEAYLGI